jgi:hypothetical protein
MGTASTITVPRRPWYTSWEGELDVTQLKAAMAHPIALGEELEEQPV